MLVVFDTLLYKNTSHFILAFVDVTFFCMTTFFLYVEIYGKYFIINRFYFYICDFKNISIFFIVALFSVIFAMVPHDVTCFVSDIVVGCLPHISALFAYILFLFVYASVLSHVQYIYYG